MKPGWLKKLTKNLLAGAGLLPLLGLSPLLVLSLVSCAGSETGSSNTNKLNPPNPTNPAQAPGVSPQPSPGATTSPTRPVSANTIGLIPPTDPDQRYREISQGKNRPNPFDINVNRPGASGPNNALQPGQPGQPVRPPLPGQPPRPLPIVGVNYPVPPLAQPSQPLLSTAVKVLGVTQVGGRNAAIIVALSEPQPRYVYEQDRLDGGIVEVRRINTQTGVVTFAENGLEISRRVGEEPISIVPAPRPAPPPPEPAVSPSPAPSPGASPAPKPSPAAPVPPSEPF